MQKLSHQKYSFDGFALDLTRGCFKGRKTSNFTQVVEVLKYLVENNGRLISKRLSFGSRHVTDGRWCCLKDIRHALSDEAQQIIRTARRGTSSTQKLETAKLLMLVEGTAGVRITMKILKRMKLESCHRLRRSRDRSQSR
jgi:DNA-binding winged helix-turn-helix (wHTH) protein